MKPTTIDRLRDALVKHTANNLNAQHRKIYDRCIDIWALITNPEYNHSTTRVVDIITNADTVEVNHNWQHGTLNRATAWRYIAQTKQLFGDARLTNRRAELHINYLRAEKAFELAITNKNEEAATRAVGAITNILKEMNDGTEGMDLSKIQPHVYKMAIPRKLLKPMEDMLASGVLDFSDLPMQLPDVEDVEHEELTE